MTVTRKPLSWWFQQFTELPDREFYIGSMGQYAYGMPDIVDSNDPEGKFPGTLYLDMPTDFDYDHCTLNQALQTAIKISLVTHMHEIAEWLKVDGERVFEPHFNHETEWNVLEEIADKAARDMLAKHPKNGDKP